MDKMGKNRDRRKLEELSCVWMKKGYAIGGKDFILQNHEAFINPGYSGKKRERHRTSWVHCIGEKVFGLVHFDDDVRGSP